MHMTRLHDSSVTSFFPEIIACVYLKLTELLVSLVA
jgi:hypothetical protein